jgi:hypothetical protein
MMRRSRHGRGNTKSTVLVLNEGITSTRSLHHRASIYVRIRDALFPCVMSTPVLLNLTPQISIIAAAIVLFS